MCCVVLGDPHVDQILRLQLGKSDGEFFVEVRSENGFLDREALGNVPLLKLSNPIWVKWRLRFGPGTSGQDFVPTRGKNNPC